MDGLCPGSLALSDRDLFLKVVFERGLRFVEGEQIIPPPHPNATDNHWLRRLAFALPLRPSCHADRQQSALGGSWATVIFLEALVLCSFFRGDFRAADNID